MRMSLTQKSMEATPPSSLGGREIVVVRQVGRKADDIILYFTEFAHLARLFE